MASHVRVRELPDRVSRADNPRLDDAGVDTAQVQRVSLLGVHQPQRVEPKPRHELLTAAVRHARGLQYGRTHCEPGTRGQIVTAQVEVDIDLVAGKSPPI